MNGAERQLREEEERAISLGIERVSYDPGPQRDLYGKPYRYDSDKLEKLKSVNDELDRLSRLYPAVRAKRLGTLYVTDVSQGWSNAILPAGGLSDLSVPNPLSPAAAAEQARFEKSRGRRFAAARPESWTRDQTRHELAHTLTTQAILDEWLGPTLFAPKFPPAWFRQSVSLYAGDSPLEQIAEVFTLMTSPGPPGALNAPELESIIRRMLGV